MGPVFLEHPSSLQHDTGGHPENATRIVAIERALSERDWLGFERMQSPAVPREVLNAVHPEPYVEAIEQACARGGGALDLDTIVSSGSFEAALRAAGGAVRLVDLLVDGDAPCGFSAHRPPGHHALRIRAMGFCVFNNVAVAAQYALDHKGLDRVMVLDWDVHHGNGTNDTFHDSDRVLFASIHQSPLYPGTGDASDVGSGEGVGFTVNLPVPPGAGDEEFLSLLEEVVIPLARAFEPQLVLISAGYDAHRDDPLADCLVTERGYASMAARMHAACWELGAPFGAVLEGGYALGPLAGGVVATLSGFVDSDGAGAVGPGSATGDGEMLVEDARRRLGQWWPSLR